VAQGQKIAARGAMRRLIRWCWVWGPAVAQMAAIFYASSIPDLSTLPGGIPDVVAHFVAYALLGALLLRALAGAHVARAAASTAWWALAATIAYGAADEVHQHFVRGRTADVGDWVVDAIGAGVAVGICWIATEAVRRRRARSGAV
jgi:VanZ family protein